MAARAKRIPERDGRLSLDVPKKDYSRYNNILVTRSNDISNFFPLYAQCFYAVILDLVAQGGMGGEATMREPLEIHPNVKGIVSSGYSEGSILKDFRTYGFVNAIAKPYNLQKLSDLLNKL